VLVFGFRDGTVQELLNPSGLPLRKGS